MPKIKAEKLTILPDYNQATIGVRYYEKLYPGKYKDNEKQAAKNFRNLRMIDADIFYEVLKEVHKEQVSNLKKAIKLKA